MKKVIFLASLILVFCFLLTSLKAQSKISYVKFRFAYHLGENKSNDFYRIGEATGNASESYYLIGYPTNLTHFYVCTYDEEEFEKGILASVIYSGKKQDLGYVSFLIDGSESYKIEIKQKVEGTTFIIAFTNGTCNQIEKKIYSVERYGLPSQPFSVYPTQLNFITMVLRNDKVVIRGDEILGPGTSKICVEYSDITPENKPIVEVRRC
ncbi:MAG: hypothetical protein QXQ69_02655 [Candidatus Aenigmatarchaeota archaeon]